MGGFYLAVTAGQLVLTTAEKSRQMWMPFESQRSNASVTNLVIGNVNLIVIAYKEHVVNLLRRVAVS